MKKRVKSLLLGVAAIVGFGAFATACLDSTSAHVHTYSEAWEKDAEGHWNALTCEDPACATIAPEKKAHVDKNNDALCDICEYDYDHTHTYAEDWTVDCTNHWHAADCGHLVVGDAMGAHVDENEDGECDVCGYVIEDIHEHYYASEWTTDESYHWHAAVCEHKDQVADKAAHVLNAAGDCTVCFASVNEVDATDIEAVLAAAMANNYKVSHGAVIATEEVYGGTGAQRLENGKTNKVHFALGNGESYIQYVSFDKDGNYIGQDEQWYEELPNGEIFGVQMEHGEYELEPIAGGAQFLNGYNYIPGSIIPSDQADTSTLANMLSALYSQMKAGIRVSEAEESYDAETGKYSFGYHYYSVRVDQSGGSIFNVELELYYVDVQFSVNEAMIIDDAEFTVEVYRDYSTSQDGVEVGDPDLDYTWNEIGDGVVEIIDLKLKPTANPTYYKYSVAQTAGERNFTTPYPRTSLIPTSFEFSYVTEYGFPDAFDFQIYEEVMIEDSLTLQEGEYAYFHLGNILPKTASTKFIQSDDFTYTFKNKDPNSNAVCWDNARDSILNGYSAYISCLKLKIRDAGEYTVTIGFGGLTKTFDVTVEGEEEPELGEDTATTIHVATTDSYGYSDTYSYTAAEEGTYTFNLPAGLGIEAGDKFVDFYDNTNGDSIVVDLEAGQTFEFTVGAIEEKVWVINVDFVAGSVDGGDVGGDEGGEDESGAVVLENIVGTYTCGAGELVINADGTMTLDNGSRVQNYTITIDGDTITYTLNGNSPYDANNNMAAYFGYLTFDANGMPETFVYNGTYPLTVSGGSEGGDEGDEGDEATAVEATIAVGENNLTIAENTYLFANVYGLSGNYTIAWNVEGVIVEINNVAVDNNGVFESASPMLGVSFKIYATDYAAVDALTLTITLNEDEGDEPGDVDEPAGWIYDGADNEISVSADDITKGYVLYNIRVWESGDYSFTSNDLFIVAITDPDGNEATSVSWGVYTLEAEVVYVVKINTQADWIPTAGTYVLSVEYQYPEGHELNPILLWEAGGYTANYAGNYAPAVWYEYTATVDGVLTVSTDSATATVMLGMKGGSAAEGVATVSLNVLAGMTYSIGVAEFDATEAVAVVFTVAEAAGTYEGDGSSNMPILFSLGQVEVNAPEWDVAYYAYKATEAGTLILTTDYANADWSVKVSGVEGAISPEEGKISVEMYEGEVIVVTVSTWDFSAATYVINAEWKAAPTGVYEGVTIALGNSSLSIADNTYIQVNVQGFETGDYTVTWNNANVIVVVDGMPMANGDTFYSLNAMYPVTFMVYAEGYVAAEVTLTIEKVVVPATPVVLGENTVSVTDTWNGTAVEFTATEAGTYTFTAGANTVLGYDYANYLPGESFEVELTEGAAVAFVVLTEDYSATDVTVTIAKAAAGGDEGGEEGDSTLAGSGAQNDPYVVTSLPFSISKEGKHDFYLTYTVEEDCTLVISYTGGYITGVPSNFEKDATAKTYTGTVVAGQVLNLNPWIMAGTATYTYTIDKLAASTPDEGGDEGGEDVGGEAGRDDTLTMSGDGTSSNPYVATALPCVITKDGHHDFYLSYTVAEAGTLKVTYVDGALVSELPDGWVKDEANLCYTIPVTAGQVVKMNLWTMRSAGTFVYTIEMLAPETPDEGGDEGGEDVGGNVGNVVTYMSAKHASGRYLKVEIDAANGTMTLTRSNMSGGWDASTSTAVYDYSYDGTTVTATKVSGQACTFTWDADVPATIVWASATFEGFTVQ